MSSLLILSTAAAFIAAICHWLSIDLAGLVLLESFTVILWWKLAELRDYTAVQPKADQSELRAEVKRWLHDRERDTRDID